jgi:hypothetical protein
MLLNGKPDAKRTQDGNQVARTVDDVTASVHVQKVMKHNCRVLPALRCSDAEGV